MNLSSHRSRGAWIEISDSLIFRATDAGRIAHAVRGLKSSDGRSLTLEKRRIAHAVRGLKLCQF